MELIEKLDPSRWQEYKELKTNSFTEAPLAFSPGLAEYELYSDQDWKDELAKSSDYPYELLFVDIDGKLIGMGGTRYYQMEQFKHNAALQTLYVRKEYRGKGIGGRLIEERMKRIGERSEIRNVLCEVFSSQQESVELHKKCGFKVVGTIKNFLHDTGSNKDYDNCLMQRTVTGRE